MDTITILGLSIILMYCVTQMLKFYGISEEVYGIYIIWYIFMACSVIVLHNNYPENH